MHQVQIVLGALFNVAMWVWNNLLNTQFGASMFGAGFGAYAAYKIASRSENLKNIRTQIRDVNVGIGICLNLINVMLQYRGQLIVDLANRYRAAFDDFVSITEGPQARAGRDVAYTLLVDLRGLNLPEFPVKELKKLLHESELSLPAARALIGPLTYSIEALVGSAAIRNDLIPQFRSWGHEEKACRYFGLRLPGGGIDETYCGAMHGIETYSEDVAYFAELLSEKLMAHGDDLAKQYGRNSPKVMKLDLSEARSKGRLADRSKYSDYEANFRAPQADMRAREIGVPPKSKIS